MQQQTAAMPTQKKALSFTDSLKKAALVFRAINHPLRRQMLQYLAENSRSTVTALYVHFRIEQSVASQHLAILRKQRLVKVERNGKYILYSVNEDRITEVEWHAYELSTIKM